MNINFVDGKQLIKQPRLYQLNVGDIIIVNKKTYNNIGNSIELFKCIKIRKDRLVNFKWYKPSTWLKRKVYYLEFRGKHDYRYNNN